MGKRVDPAATTPRRHLVTGGSRLDQPSPADASKKTVTHGPEDSLIFFIVPNYVRHGLPPGVSVVVLETVQQKNETSGVQYHFRFVYR